MPIREVNSPINSSNKSRGLGIGSDQPLSPGARGMPGRRADRMHDVPQAPPRAHVHWAATTNRHK